MMYVVDTDLILEGIIDRPQYSPHAIRFWEQVELRVEKDCFYITNIGFQRVQSIILSLVTSLSASQEKAEEMMNLVLNNFKVIEINREMLMMAKKKELCSLDFESAIELICAEKLINSRGKRIFHSVAIVTDRHEDFKLSYIEKSSRLNPKVIKVDDFIEHAEIEKLLSNGSVNSSNYETNFNCVKQVNFYIALAEKYGGNDSGYYAERYDVIENKWLILQQVLKYCCKRANNSKGYYEKFKYLYKLLNRFCDLYHHQEERIYWLNKLKKLSLKYNEVNDYLYASTREIWALIMTHRFSKAKQEIKNIHKKIETVGDPLLLCYFYHCYVTYCVRNKEWTLAKSVFDLYFSSYRKLELYLAVKIHDANLDDDKETYRKIWIRETINFNRDITKYMYRKAWLDLQKTITDTNSGKIVCHETCSTVKILQECFNNFNTCLNDAMAIDWQRGVSYCYSQMVNISLYLAYFCNITSEREKLIDQAKEFTKIGLKIAVQNKNYRRIASFYESRSFLEELQGNEQRAQEDSNMSKKLFKMTGENNSGISKPANSLAS